MIVRNAATLARATPAPARFPYRDHRTAAAIDPRCRLCLKAHLGPCNASPDVDELNSDEVLDGYVAALRNEPEPTYPRSRSYWHGRNAGADDVPLLRVNPALRRFAREARG